jgi:hypothetical protein
MHIKARHAKAFSAFVARTCVKQKREVRRKIRKIAARFKKKRRPPRRGARDRWYGGT